MTNDLAQVASEYRVSKHKLQELIEIKNKLLLIECPSTELSMTKFVGAEGELDFSEPYSYPNLFYPEIFEFFAIDNMSNNMICKCRCIIIQTCHHRYWHTIRLFPCGHGHSEVLHGYKLSSNLALIWWWGNIGILVDTGILVVNGGTKTPMSDYVIAAVVVETVEGVVTPIFVETRITMVAPMAVDTLALTVGADL